MGRRWLSTVVKYGIGLSLLAFVVYRHWEPDKHGGIGLKAALSGPIRWELFIVSAICCAASAAITFVRWYVLVRAQDLPFTLRNAFRLGLVGYFFNTFLPGAVGGDLVKAAFIAREQKRRTVAVSTVLMDRAIGLLGLIAIAAVVGTTFWYFDDSILNESPTQPSAATDSGKHTAASSPSTAEHVDKGVLRSRVLMRQVIRMADVITIVALFSWLLLGFLPEHRSHIFARRLYRIPKIGKILAEVWHAVFLYRRRTLTIVVALLLTVVAHILNVLTFFFAILAFQSEGGIVQIPSLVEHFILVPAGMAFQGFIPTPGGIGGAEWVYSAFYWGFGYPGAGGVLGSLGMRLVQWLLGIIGYAVYLFMKSEMPPTSPVESEPDQIHYPAPSSSAAQGELVK